MLSSHWWSISIGNALLKQIFLLCFSFSQMGLFCVIFNCCWTLWEAKIVGVVKISSPSCSQTQIHTFHFKYFTLVLSQLLSVFVGAFVNLLPRFTTRHSISLGLSQRRSCRTQKEQKFMPRVMTSAFHLKSVILQHGNISDTSALWWSFIARKWKIFFNAKDQTVFLCNLYKLNALNGTGSTRNDCLIWINSSFH